MLDIINIPLLRATPTEYQQENWLLDSSQRWQKAGQWPADALGQLVDPVDALWIDGHSSGSGSNDRVPFADATALDSSLRLIKVDSLQVTVSAPYNEGGIPVLRGRFRHCNNDYSLRITDPDAESGAIDLAYGDYQAGQRFLTISLGGPYEGYSYKLIANIIRPG